MYNLIVATGISLTNYLHVGEYLEGCFGQEKKRLPPKPWCVK